MSFLGMKMEPDQAYLGQWVLLSMSFIMLCLILALGLRLHYLERRSLDSDTVILSTPPYAYFLGIAMEPRQAARKQWLLLGLCFVLMLCCIGLLITIFIHRTRKPPWMKAEWQS